MADTPRMAQLRALLEDDPHDPFLRYGLAMEHVAQGDDMAAATQFASLLANAPDYVPAYLMCAQALNRLDRTDDAASVLRAGVGAAARNNEQHALGELQAMLAILE